MDAGPGFKICYCVVAVRHSRIDFVGFSTGYPFHSELERAKIFKLEKDFAMAVTPLITTIIPTFRRPNILQRAINSVLNQTYPHFQVCVYDNASGDETAEVVAEIRKKDSRVKYYCHSENIGAIKNFNSGLAHVEAPFFSLLSDDDIVLPEFYETALAGFERYPEAVFSATEVIYVDTDGKVRGSSNPAWKPGYYLPPYGVLTMLEQGHPPTWTGVLFRSMVIEQVGILDETVGGAIDYDFEQRIAARLPFVLSRTPGAIFVIHSSSWGQSSGLSFIWPGWLQMIRNITEDERIPLFARERAGHLLREELKRKVFHYGRQSIKQKNFEETYRAAHILYRHFDARAISFLLYGTGKCCQYFPPAHYVLTRLNRLRLLLIHSESDNSSAKIENYARYLEM